MNKPNSLKITLIGAGSASFGPATITDIIVSEILNKAPLEICLMDLKEEALQYSKKYALDAAAHLKRDNLTITSTTSLEESLQGASYVITAVELKRMHYWSQDFHIPRKYGFRQVYGENGGPGGMFHTLRNLKHMMEIARAMERICPDAWLLNYTNPEAKIVEAISRLTKVKVAGLCHGFHMAKYVLADMLEVPHEDLDLNGCGLNHFGFYQEIKSKKTGEDLYPVLREKEKKAKWLSMWDEIALSRILFRTYGLWPYPGTNHFGEYFAWADQFLASSMVQFFYDPAEKDPWKTGETPAWIYNLSCDAHNITHIPPYDKEVKEANSNLASQYEFREDRLRCSGEVAIPIIEAISFGDKKDNIIVNMQNKGHIPGLPDEMVVEFPALVDETGIHPHQMEALPAAVTEMIRIQGVIHQLVIEAYSEQSRMKLLQALLLDPTVSNYNNAVALINEMCELQKDVLPTLNW